MEPAFTGIWIPREVLEHEGLSMTDKFVYAIIDGLDNEEGCWASNGYIAKIANVSDRQIKNIIKNLMGCGLVVRMTTDEGRRVLRTVSRLALLKVKGGETNFTGGVKQTSPEGVKQTSPNRIGYKIDDIKGAYEIPAHFTDAFTAVWGEWLEYRRETRKPLKLMTAKAQLDMLSKATESDAIECIRNSIRNGWQGLFLTKPSKPSYVKRQPLTNTDHTNGF
jgi:hypothetical protein